MEDGKVIKIEDCIFESAPTVVVGLLGVEITADLAGISGYTAAARLEEIERRILAIEARLNEPHV